MRRSKEPDRPAAFAQDRRQHRRGRAFAVGARNDRAFRAKRRADASLVEAAQAIHVAIGEIPIDGAFVNVVLCRWHGPSPTFCQPASSR